MRISEKIKAINNKLEQNKTQYDLNRQTGKISALLSGRVSKYEIARKRLATISCLMKRFEYSHLGKELKATTEKV